MAIIDQWALSSLMVENEQAARILWRIAKGSFFRQENHSSEEFPRGQKVPIIQEGEKSFHFYLFDTTSNVTICTI